MASCFFRAPNVFPSGNQAHLQLANHAQSYHLRFACFQVVLPFLTPFIRNRKPFTICNLDTPRFV